MANKILTKVNLDCGLNINSGVIVTHEPIYRSTEMKLVMPLTFYYNLECVPNPYIGYSGKKPLTGVIDENSNLIYKCDYNLKIEDQNKIIAKLAHNAVNSYLEEKFGFWNITDEQYGIYLDLTLNSNTKILTVPSSYDYIKIRIDNETSGDAIFSLGTSVISDDLKSNILIKAGEFYEFDTDLNLNNKNIYIITNGINLRVRIKLIKNNLND